MRAVILAAGRGSRMQDVGDARPKCLVESHGYPDIDLTPPRVRLTNVRDVVL